jgi:hypothetical protein
MNKVIRLKLERQTSCVNCSREYLSIDILFIDVANRYEGI